MQVFILDEDMKKNSQYYMDKHVVKIPTEIAQILSTTLRLKGYKGDDIYKSTHIHHPWVLWCNESWNNFYYLTELANYLCTEYDIRYDKKIKSSYVIAECYLIACEMSKIKCELELLFKNHTPFPLCMPDKYKINNVVESYRNYYKGEKRHLANWKNREIPEWWK